MTARLWHVCCRQQARWKAKEQGKLRNKEQLAAALRRAPSRSNLGIAVQLVSFRTELADSLLCY
jgi:hypothetical protein